MNNLADLIGLTFAFLLTLAIFSYLIGDNPIYRIAVNLLVGVGIGYATVVVIDTVLVPWLGDLLALIQTATQPPADPTRMAAYQAYVFEQTLLLVPPIIFVVLLAFKLLDSTAYIGNTSMGLLVGIGAGVAVGGAVLGTLIPQVLATLNYSGSSANLLPSNFGMVNALLNGVIIILGTAFSLLAFFYGPNPIYFLQPGGGVATPNQPRNIVMRSIEAIGRGFVLFTLAALYAGAVSTAFTLLGERLIFLWTTLLNLVGAG